MLQIKAILQLQLLIAEATDNNTILNIYIYPKI